MLKLMLRATLFSLIGCVCALAQSIKPGPQPMKLQIDHSFGRGSITGPVKWHPDGDRLVVSTPTGAWIYSDRLVDIAHLPGIQAATFSPDGQWLAGTDADQQIVLFDTTAYRPAHTLASDQSTVNVLAWNPVNNAQLASADADGNVIVWDTVTGAAMFQDQFMADIADLEWSPDGQHLATAYHWNATETVVWNIQQEQHVLNLPTHNLGGDYPYPWQKINWHNEHILTRSSNDATEAWNINTGQPLESLSEMGITQPYCGTGIPSLSPDKQLCISRGFFTTTLRNPTSGQDIYALPHRDDLFVSRVAWSDDSRKIAIYDNHELLTWDVVRAQVSGQNTIHAQIGNYLSISPDGSQVAIADVLHSARLFNLTTGEQIAYMDGHDQPIRELAWQPDGDLLATRGWQNRAYGVSEDTTVHIWNMARPTLDMQPQTTLQFDSSVMDIDWGPDGQELLIVANQDIWVWDVEQQGFSLYIDPDPILKYASVDVRGGSYRETNGLTIVIGTLCCTEPGHALTFDAQTGQLIDQTRSAFIRYDGSLMLRFPYSNPSFRLGGGANRIVAWDLDQGRIQSFAETFFAVWEPAAELALISANTTGVHIFDRTEILPIAHLAIPLNRYSEIGFDVIRWDTDTHQVALAKQGVLSVWTDKNTAR